MSLLVFQHHDVHHPAELGRVLRDHGHRLRVVRLHDGDKVPVDMDNVEGVISLGGPMSVDDTAEHAWLQTEQEYLANAHKAGLPIVAIGLGAQLLTRGLGGEVAPMKDGEAGWGGVKLEFFGTIDTMYAGTPWQTQQFFSHTYEITKTPPGSAPPLAGSKRCKVEAFNVGMTTYCYQYHFEWTKADILAATKLPTFRFADKPIPEIVAETDKHYDLYRHLGNRQCERIAALLFPIDKKITLNRPARARA